jgi:hypothetical protein
MKRESQTVDRDDSELVQVKFDMGAGNLKIPGGTDKLAAADFRYGAAAPKPEVHYSSAAGRGDLSITQSGSSSSLSHTSKDWDLRFNQDVPLKIEIHMGGAHLDLGRLTLRNLDVDMGCRRPRSGPARRSQEELRRSREPRRRRLYDSRAIWRRRGGASLGRYRRRKYIGPSPRRQPFFQRCRRAFASHDSPGCPEWRWRFKASLGVRRNHAGRKK